MTAAPSRSSETAIVSAPAKTLSTSCQTASRSSADGTTRVTLHCHAMPKYLVIHNDIVHAKIHAAYG